MSNGIIIRTRRNRQPRDISRLNLDRGGPNFLPRLLACLVLHDGAEVFRNSLYYRLEGLNQKLGTDYDSSSALGYEAASEIAEIWLRDCGRRIQCFSPVDAARCWAAGPHGHLERSTVEYWRAVQKHFASSKSTAALIAQAEEEWRKLLERTTP